MRDDHYQRMLRDLSEQIRLADDLGHVSVSFTEHHFHIEGTLTPRSAVPGPAVLTQYNNPAGAECQRLHLIRRVDFGTIRPPCCISSRSLDCGNSLSDGSPPPHDSSASFPTRFPGPALDQDPPLGTGYRRS